jgi:DNA-binding IclR family transcriptional regulator
MAHTYEELKHKTVAQLREIAAEVKHDALQGYTQLNKEHLLVALCKALGISAHEHHAVKGMDKAAVKAQIKELKKERDTALAAHDHPQLKAVRRKIHALKVHLHRAEVLAP